MEDVVVNPGLVIPANCLRLSFSRSGGPGGQNVNKLNTRVSISLDIAACPAFSEEQKQRLLKGLKNRLDKNGVLTVNSQEHRSQHANRVEAAELLGELLRRGLKRPRVRKKTAVPKGAIRKRLEAKKRRSAIKQSRSQKIDD